MRSPFFRLKLECYLPKKGIAQQRSASPIKKNIKTQPFGACHPPRTQIKDALCTHARRPPWQLAASLQTNPDFTARTDIETSRRRICGRGDPRNSWFVPINKIRHASTSCRRAFYPIVHPLKKPIRVPLMAFRTKSSSPAHSRLAVRRAGAPFMYVVSFCARRASLAWSAVSSVLHATTNRKRPVNGVLANPQFNTAFTHTDDPTVGRHEHRVSICTSHPAA